MPRLAIVLPVVLPGSASGTPAEDRDAVVHPLPVELPMDVAEAVEQLGREDAVEHLGFLQAQDVGLLLGDSCSTSAVRARTELMFQDAIFSRCAHVRPLSPSAAHNEKAPAPGAWSEGQPSVRHARDPADPGNRGKPRALQDRSCLFRLARLTRAMNRSQYETIFTRFFFGSA